MQKSICASSGLIAYPHPSRQIYRGQEDHWEEFQRGCELLFERVYGPLRAAVTRAVEGFLKCGILHYRFARLQCEGCGRNRFLAYSCRTRCFCPSCAAERSAAFTDRVASELLEPVSHRQVVFTLPEVLRPVFRKNRRLLGRLCGSAWETLKEMRQEAFPEEDVRGAAVIAIRTAGDQPGRHPHWHGLVPDAAWTRDRRRLPISYPDPEAMTRIFQAKVPRMRVDEHCLSPEFAAPSPDLAA